MIPTQLTSLYKSIGGVPSIPSDFNTSKSFQKEIYQHHYHPFVNSAKNNPNSHRIHHMARYDNMRGIVSPKPLKRDESLLLEEMEGEPFSARIKKNFSRN